MKKPFLAILAGAIAVICLVAIALWRPTPAPTGTQHQVQRVVSGQTLEIAGKDGKLKRVRLLGIKAPDLQQRPWGPLARKRLEELIDNKPILLENDLDAEDSYQRRLAYAWRDKTLLNEKLVKEGHALAVSQIPNTKYDERLAHAQEWARVMGKGIWDPENPMRLTPDEFRERYR